MAGLDIDEDRMVSTAGEGFGRVTELAAIAGYDAGSALAARVRRADVAPDHFAHELARDR